MTILGYHSSTTFTSRLGPLIATLHRHGSSLLPTAQYTALSNITALGSSFVQRLGVHPTRQHIEKPVSTEYHWFAECFLEFLNMSQMAAWSALVRGHSRTGTYVPKKIVDVKVCICNSSSNNQIRALR